jgi:transposase InsO family protein
VIEVMARKVTPMDVRLLAAVTGSLEKVNVRALCRERGVSPKTFYKYRARFAAEGLAGLEERSRRPKRSPARVSAEVENAIVKLRKELGNKGADGGAATIRWNLERHTQIRPPSEATIWRILVRRGFVVPEPKKRPKASLRRFEATAPNECWQVDVTEWTLATGAVVEILNLLDDHSRFVPGSRALARVTTENAWESFLAVAQRWGLPTRCLSDNGLVFTGRLHGMEVEFERQLRAAGVLKVNARPYHPQTCGKVERFQQTEKKWLRARRPPPATIEELQAALDAFTDYYNHDRPHRGIGRVTPWERFSASPPATPGEALPRPQRHVRVVVNQTGKLDVRPWQIGLGLEYAGQAAEVVLDGTHATVFIEGRLVRYLELDPTRRYQPTRRPTGRPRLQP